jgi:hypothetical protein
MTASFFSKKQQLVVGYQSFRLSNRYLSSTLSNRTPFWRPAHSHDIIVHGISRRKPSLTELLNKSFSAQQTPQAAPTEIIEKDHLMMAFLLFQDHLRLPADFYMRIIRLTRELTHWYISSSVP